MTHERIYLNPEDDRVYIDTYIADGAARDAILVAPGGGYGKVCADREGEPIALDFLAAGYNAFVLNYRVGKNTDVFPAQLIDAASAMVYIREHSEDLRVNPKRVFAVGFSAGGHLIGSLATMYKYEEVKAVFGERYKLVRPTGAILSYPVTSANHPTHTPSFVRLIGKPFEECSESEKQRLSLDTAIDKDSSPMFLWHTAKDNVVPVIGTLATAAACTKAGVAYQLAIYPYGPHGIALGDETSARGESEIQPLAAHWRRAAREWLRTLSDSNFDN